MIILLCPKFSQDIEHNKHLTKVPHFGPILGYQSAPIGIKKGVGQINERGGTNGNEPIEFEIYSVEVQQDFRKVTYWFRIIHGIYTSN